MEIVPCGSYCMQNIFIFQIHLRTKALSILRDEGRQFELLRGINRNL